MSRKKILISAYACSPLRGSEHGTGWNTSWELARNFDVHVLTRSKNRTDIESFLKDQPGSDRTITVHYLELPAAFARAKSHGVLPLAFYYSMWQVAALAWGRKHLPVIKPDLCHHLTFNSFEFPSFWHRFSIPTVLGPLGGGQTAPQELLPLVGSMAGAERIRSLRVAASEKNPFVRDGLRAAKAVIFANAETRFRLEKWVTGSVHEMVDVGVDSAKFVPAVKNKQDGILRLLYVGKFENRKGVHLIPEILSALKRKAYPFRIQFVGDGPELNRVRAACERSALAESCEFSGKLSHERTVQSYQNADFVIFPSVRDTSGAVALEALSCGCPVVCFHHQGAAWMVSPDTGILVNPREAASIPALADVFARELISCHSDVVRHGAMRQAARLRAVSQFSWPAKAQVLTEIYQSVLRQRS